jgi:undecaprenyl diphosphate synthase
LTEFHFSITFYALIDKEKLSMSQLPKHLGLIPDGNRRWARATGHSLAETYCLGMEKIVECLETLLTMGIPKLSIYLLSKDNLARQGEDLDAVLAAEEWGVTTLFPVLKDRFEATFTHAGRADLLPPALADGLSTLCTSLATNSNTPTIYLCLGYDATDEIIQALQNTPQSADFRDYLWVPDPLDLIIRTSGYQRLSGFLPLQSEYAELYFAPYYFPEITPARLQAALESYAQRQRHYGR